MAKNISAAELKERDHERHRLDEEERQKRLVETRAKENEESSILRDKFTDACRRAECSMRVATGASFNNDPVVTVLDSTNAKHTGALMLELVKHYGDRFKFNAAFLKDLSVKIEAVPLFTKPNIDETLVHHYIIVALERAVKNVDALKWPVKDELAAFVHGWLCGHKSGRYYSGYPTSY